MSAASGSRDQASRLSIQLTSPVMHVGTMRKHVERTILRSRHLCEALRSLEARAEFETKDRLRTVKFHAEHDLESLCALSARLEAMGRELVAIQGHLENAI